MTEHVCPGKLTPSKMPSAQCTIEIGYNWRLQ